MFGTIPRHPTPIHSFVLILPDTRRQTTVTGAPDSGEALNCIKFHIHVDKI